MTTLSFGKTVVVDEKFDVQRHILRLRGWESKYETMMRTVETQIDTTGSGDPVGMQIGEQLVKQIPRLGLYRVLEPLESVSAIVERSMPALENNLRLQYAALSKASRKYWLRNLDFIMTPDYRTILDQIRDVCEEAWYGNQMNYLLGGDARMGKTRLMEWLYICNLPYISEDRNIAPMILVDAPEGGTYPQISLMRRMISSIGRVYMRRDRKDDLLEKMAVFCHQCRVKLVGVDEIHRFRTETAKHSLIEISNQIRLVPMVCASCQPARFTENEPEIQGRWMKKYTIKRYKGVRLEQLMAFVDLILPFAKSSGLYLQKIGDSDGPAAVIEKKTDGRMGFITWLIRKASITAIEHGMPNLTVQLLNDTWNSRPTHDPFFDDLDDEG